MPGTGDALRRTSDTLLRDLEALLELEKRLDVAKQRVRRAAQGVTGPRHRRPPLLAAFSPGGGARIASTAGMGVEAGTRD